MDDESTRDTGPPGAGSERDRETREGGAEGPAQGDPRPPLRDRLLTAAAVALLRTVMAGLGTTWRMRVVAGEEAFEGLVLARRAAVFAAWHEHLFGLTRFLHRRCVARGYPLAVLNSRSRDGELGSRFALSLGGQSIRGSSTRGGTQALRGAVRALQGGTGLYQLADGPKGPPHRAKPGTVLAAGMAGAPLVPLAFAADRAWRLGSWDRLVIPKPFARVAVAVGEPQEVPRRLAGEALEARLAALDQALERQAERAAAALAGR
ncbi:MAG TPA: lysophospholipid acyltransferase family protein [Thermoanaerobaculia bacterium]|nr:lysophospholipid acyltransferase family protein [Thermoanaerobaculia bacterium]